MILNAWNSKFGSAIIQAQLLDFTQRNAHIYSVFQPTYTSTQLFHLVNLSCSLSYPNRVVSSSVTRSIYNYCNLFSKHLSICALLTVKIFITLIKCKYNQRFNLKVNVNALLNLFRTWTLFIVKNKSQYLSILLISFIISWLFIKFQCK